MVGSLHTAAADTKIAITGYFKSMEADPRHRAALWLHTCNERQNVCGDRDDPDATYRKRILTIISSVAGDVTRAYSDSDMDLDGMWKQNENKIRISKDVAARIERRSREKNTVERDRGRANRGNSGGCRE